MVVIIGEGGIDAGEGQVGELRDDLLRLIPCRSCMMATCLTWMRLPAMRGLPPQVSGVETMCSRMTGSVPVAVGVSGGRLAVGSMSATCITNAEIRAGSMNRKDDVVSASEITSWAWCPESWRLDSLGAEPENRAALVRGERFHARRPRSKDGPGRPSSLGFGSSPWVSSWPSWHSSWRGADGTQAPWSRSRPGPSRVAPGRRRLRGRRKRGLGSGETVALDDVTLFSEALRLVGRPDRLVGQGETLIPEEWSSWT